MINTLTAKLERLAILPFQHHPQFRKGPAWQHPSKFHSLVKASCKTRSFFIASGALPVPLALNCGTSEKCICCTKHTGFGDQGLRAGTSPAEDGKIATLGSLSFENSRMLWGVGSFWFLWNALRRWIAWEYLGSSAWVLPVLAPTCPKSEEGARGHGAGCPHGIRESPGTSTAGAKHLRRAQHSENREGKSSGLLLRNLK